MSDPRKDIAHVWSNLSTWEGETGTQVVFVAAQMVPSRDHSHIRGSRQNNYLSSLFGNFELAQNGARLVIFGKFQMKRKSVQLFCEPAKVQTKCRNPAVSVCAVITARCHSCRDETDHQGTPPGTPLRGVQPPEAGKVIPVSYLRTRT